MRCERHSADVTLVGFHTVVDPCVNFEITALGEVLHADIALERFKTFVGPNVDFETTRP